MPIPPADVTQFLQILMERRFAETERVFEQLRKRVQKTEWNKGYLQALNGMLLAQKSDDDRYLFLSNINFSNGDELRKYRREFLKYAKSRLHADYDCGFFSAWAEYMRILFKVKR